MDIMKAPFEERLKLWHGEDWHTPKGRLIRDIVYALDTGLVTTVSFIAGASASLISRERVIVAGLIQVVAGTLSIFFGAYVSTKAQKYFFESQIERERREIEEDPEREIREVKEIFSDMGFTEEEQEIAVRRVTANKERWLEFMVQEEIGINAAFIDSPFEIAFVSAVSFLVGAIPAIAPFFLVGTVGAALSIAFVAVLIFLFAVGVYKSKFTKARWFSSGIETLTIGVLSCGTGFFLGKIIAGFSH